MTGAVHVHADPDEEVRPSRDVLLIVHTGRDATRRVAVEAARRLGEEGFTLRVMPDEYSTDVGLFDELPEAPAAAAGGLLRERRPGGGRRTRARPRW